MLNWMKVCCHIDLQQLEGCDILVCRSSFTVLKSSRASSKVFMNSHNVCFINLGIALGIDGCSKSPAYKTRGERFRVVFRKF